MLHHIENWKQVFKSRRWLILPPLLVGVLILAGLTRAKKEIPRLPLKEQVTRIQVVRLKPQTVNPKVIGYGTAQPQREWTAVAEVGGRIIETHPDLDSGKTIAAGQTLLKIDKSDYESQLNQKKADHTAAKARVEELTASQISDGESLKFEQDLLKVTERELGRVKKLFEANTVTATEMDQVQGEVLRQLQAVQKLKKSLSLYKSQIASAKASVTLAKSRVDEAQRNVDRTTITSPFSGVLANVKLEKDQVISVGEQLFQIQDNMQVEIEAHISLAQLDRFVPKVLYSEGKRASDFSDKQILNSLSASVSSRSGNLTNTWHGTPVRISESIDQQTRTLGIVIRVNNKIPDRPKTDSNQHTSEKRPEAKLSSNAQDRKKKNYSNSPLRSGTYCEITLSGTPMKKAMMLPRTAFDGDYVYVVDKESRLHRRKVKRGFPVGKQIVVVSGLKFGEVVALKPPVPAIDGMLVKIK